MCVSMMRNRVCCCVHSCPHFQGHIRAAQALTSLHRYAEALAQLKEAARVEPGSKLVAKAQVLHVSVTLCCNGCVCRGTAVRMTYVCCVS